MALTEDCAGLLSELVGLVEGGVQGKGGSQHLRYKNFISNGITGGMVPVAVGLGFSLLKCSKDGIVVALFGDGAMNEGYLLESLNLAAVFHIPILFVLENNHYAMSTPVESVTRKPLMERPKALGIETHYIEAHDPIELWHLSDRLIRDIRADREPRFIEIKTFRFSGHSKSDKREYIPEEEDKYWHKHDPLTILNNQLGNDLSRQIVQNVDDIVAEALGKMHISID